MVVFNSSENNHKNVLKIKYFYGFVISILKDVIYMISTHILRNNNNKTASLIYIPLIKVDICFNPAGESKS